MNLIDFDGLFDEKLAEYMEMNKGKYTEKQWVDIIPKLYVQFGDTYVGKVKCTPKEYYAKMTDVELVNTLEGHLKNQVPVPQFLCDELEKRNPEDELLHLLKSDDNETVSYAINLLGNSEKAFDGYFNILSNGLFDEDVRDNVVDKLKECADAVKDKALETYKKGIATEYMLEILSKITVRDEEVFNILCKVFTECPQNLLYASYLSSYGDERALPLLMKRIENKEIGFVEFQELKYAIEALGGEYNVPRDFSDDNDYIAVENASSREGFNENLKS